MLPDSLGSVVVSGAGAAQQVCDYNLSGGRKRYDQGNGSESPNRSYHFDRFAGDFGAASALSKTGAVGFKPTALFYAPPPAGRLNFVLAGSQRPVSTSANHGAVLVGSNTNPWLPEEPQDNESQQRKGDDDERRMAVMGLWERPGESVRVPANHGPLRAGIAGRRNDRVRCPRLCKRQPSRLVSRRSGNARWFARSVGWMCVSPELLGRLSLWVNDRNGLGRAVGKSIAGRIPSFQTPPRSFFPLRLCGRCRPLAGHFGITFRVDFFSIV
jgi:hypothetical protein